MKLCTLKTEENSPIADWNWTTKDLALQRAVEDGFLGLAAKVHAEKEERINSLFGGKDGSPFKKAGR